MEFVSRQENQPLWGEEALCSYCQNEFLEGYYNENQIACENCIFEYLENELHIVKKRND